MFRSAVLVRDAAVDDLESLRTIFGTDSGPELDEKPGEGACAIASIAADPDQRLVVAGHDGRVVGAAHLVRAPLSPLQSAMAVHVAHLHVLEGSRRRGVGTALIEAAVSWAEEKDTDHVLVAASVSSRDANRFLARLGLTQLAVVRAASVTTLRAKLPVDPPPVCHGDNRHQRTVGQILARRRSMRRAAQSKAL